MFIPDIVAWMNDEARRKLYVKSRRIGVTYGHAYDRVSRRVRGLRRKAYYTGVSLDMAREYMDYCAFHARTFHLAGDIVEGQAEATYRTADGKRRKLQIKTFELEFPNGSRIVAMPSRPAALRGRDGDVDADELPFHEDQPGLYKAAIHVTKWGGQFAGWGSHNGEGTQFHNFELNCRRVLNTLGIDPDAGHSDVALERLAAIGHELRLRPIFSFHRTTIEQAVEQGLVELLNAVTDSNHTRESFLTECRDECLNDEHYGQEYLCRAVTALLAALKYHVIEACQHEGCAGPIEGFEQLDEFVGSVAKATHGGRVFIGVDVGRTQDLTVIWPFEQVGDVLWSLGLLRLRRCSLVDQERAIERLFGVLRVGRCAILKRGIGQGIFDHLVRKFGEGRIGGIDETRPVKVALVGGIVQAFEDRRVRVPLDHEVKEALHGVREVRTPGGQVTYDAPRSDAGHADEFWAAAAAIDCIATAAGGLTAENVQTLRAAIGRGNVGTRERGNAEMELATQRRQRQAAHTGHALSAGKGVW